MRRRRYRLDIAYEGTNFRGWQRQSGPQEDEVPSISALLATAIRKTTGAEEFKFHGSGRTDVGVHARQQCAHLELETKLEPATLQRALNSCLPPELRILAVTEAAPEFHAQNQVRAKTYRYFILHKPEKDDAPTWPFLERWAWFVPQKLDYEAMQAALKHFVGKHDFKAFQNVGTVVTHTVREIFRAEFIVHDWKTTNPGDLPWLPPPDSSLRLLEFRLTGKGFLKQMVRNIVGTVVDCGKGKLTSDEVKRILESKDRQKSGPTAPGHGLILDNVEY